MALLSESTECNSTPEMLAKQQPQVKTDMSSAASESEPPMEIHATDDNHQPLPTLVEVKITPAIFIMKGFIAKQEVMMGLNVKMVKVLLFSGSQRLLFHLQGIENF